MDVEAKLSASEKDEKQELVLFQYLSSLDKQLKDGTGPNNNGETLRFILKYASLRFPRQSVPIRHLMARILNTIFDKAEGTRSLFDTMNSLCNILSELKSEGTLSAASCIIHIIGSLEEKHGEKIISLLGRAVSLITSKYRQAKDTELSLRVEALNALVSSLKGAGPGAHDDMIKEMLRLAKSAIQDKVVLVREKGLQVFCSGPLTHKLLEAVYTNTNIPGPQRIDEYETPFSIVSKCLAGGDAHFRQCVAETMASLLSNFQRKKSSTNLESSEADVSKAYRAIVIDDILNILNTAVSKTTSREVRVGILHVYVSFFKVDLHHDVINRSRDFL